MYIIIVGGGRLGSSLVELALGDGHDVTLIEAGKARAQAAAQRFDARVLHADIAEGGILEEAEASRADVLVATTEDDSANLMAMFLGTEAEIGTRVSVVNDKLHRGLFERLGVHVLLDPEVIVAEHLYGLIRQPEVEDAIALPGGGHAFEVVVRAGSPLVGKDLREAREAKLLDGTLVVVWVKRGGKGRVPTDETRFAAGDHLTVFSPAPISKKQLETFTG
jgi:trk system potassium uptake protein TrkA